MEENSLPDKQPFELTNDMVYTGLHIWQTKQQNEAELEKIKENNNQIYRMEVEKNRVLLENAKQEQHRKNVWTWVTAGATAFTVFIAGLVLMAYLGYGNYIVFVISWAISLGSSSFGTYQYALNYGKKVKERELKQNNNLTPTAL